MAGKQPRKNETASMRREIFPFLCILALTFACSGAETPQKNFTIPIRTVVDLDLGEEANVRLSDGGTVAVKLLEMEHLTDPFRLAVRKARVKVLVDGEEVILESANYNLPASAAGIRIDCPVTGAYYENSNVDRWGLEKAARLRLWPAEGPFTAPGSFAYPVGQRILANDTQMSNEPCYVDGGEIPESREIYYHSGLDFGGSEGLVEVYAATDGLVVSSGDSVLAGHAEGTPVMPRYDVVYVLDGRGWYYRYSHMKTIEPWVFPGARVKLGRRIGILGKEGGSGGWSHLHFEIRARQPSGKWGTEEAYVYAWEAYLQEHKPKVVAVARPHFLAAAGDTVTLDGGKSMSLTGGDLDYEWIFTDGTTAGGAVTKRCYDKPGTFYETLKVTDRQGNLDYDFAVVQVIDKEHPDRLPPSLHANYYPTLGVRTGDRVTFKVRSFNAADGEEIWDFGDGSPRATTRSVAGYSYRNERFAKEGTDYNDIAHHPRGYAETVHTFEQPGHYIVSIERTGEWGIQAAARLHVEVHPR